MLTPVIQNRIISGLLAAICLLLLWLNHRYSVEFDLSANSRNSLSITTIDALTLLPMPLEVIAVLPPNTAQQTAIADHIEKLRQYKPDIALSFVNPEIEPDRVRELEASSGGELILRYLDREKRLQTLSERTFTKAIFQLSRTAERTVAFVTGHGERAPDRPINDGYSVIAARLAQSGINSTTLSLVSVPRIPDNVDTLVIASPTKKFFPGEVASVLEFVSRGGNLLWLIDSDDFYGLQALAFELGIALAPGIVIDANSSAWGADSPTFVIVDKFSQHPVNQGLQSPVLLPEARALEITPLAGQTVTPLLQSSAESWTETGALQGSIRFDPQSGDQRGPLTLAIAIERKHSQSMQRIIVAADADLFASTWIGNGANQEYGERLFNWLANDDTLINFKTIEPADSIVELDKRQVMLLGGGFLIALPLLFLLTGSYHWYRQKHV